MPPPCPEPPAREMLRLRSAQLCRHRARREQSWSLPALGNSSRLQSAGAGSGPALKAQVSWPPANSSARPGPAQGAPSRSCACPLKVFLHRALPWQILLPQMRSLSPPGRICCRQLAPRGAPAPPNPPSAGHTVSPDPPPGSAGDLTVVSAGSELGGPSICLRLLETSSGR